MPAGNSSSRPSGRSSGRGNSGSSSSGRSSSGSRSGSGRPSSGRPAGSRPSSGRPASGGSGRASSSRPSSDRPTSSRSTRDGETRSSSRPRRDDARPTRDNARSAGGSSRPSSGRPARDGDRRTSTGRPARDGERRTSSDRRDSGRPRRDDSRGLTRGPGDNSRRPRRDDDRGENTARSRRGGSDAPIIPDHITGEELPRAVRNELRTLPDGLALRVARHMAACVELANFEPELSWLHAKAALDKASRIAVVRETAAGAAYHAGHFDIALSEYRAAKRMTGNKEYWPVMADCERALGRPAKAIAMASDPIVAGLSIGGRVEMRIVVSGARLDQGNAEAALATLQCPELNKPSNEPWSARIRYAYADILATMERTQEAIEWFHRAAAVDVDGQTDADRRIAELEGSVYEEFDNDYVYEDYSDDE